MVVFFLGLLEYSRENADFLFILTKFDSLPYRIKIRSSKNHHLDLNWTKISSERKTFFNNREFVENIK